MISPNSKARLSCWGAMILLTVFALLACTTPGRVLPRLTDIVTPPCPDTSDYSSLTRWAAIGTAIAVVCTLISIWFPGPKIRATAGAGIGIAVGAWVLKFLLVEYMWIAALLAFVAAVIAALAFMWGHRKKFERFVNMDIDGDGKIGHDMG